MKRKIVIIFMLVAALFVFVAIFKNIQMDNQELISSGNTETEPCVKNKVKKEGVYFRELQPEYEIKRFYYRPYTCYAYSTLYYNGRIYKSAMQVDVKCEEPDTELLSDVYGNHKICWSEDAGMLTGVTDRGTIYKAMGYREEDVICLFYKGEQEGLHKSKESINIKQYFICLNGIYLSDGKDLYKDKLHLEDVKSIYVSKDIYGTGRKEVLFKNIKYEKFMKGLYKSSFLQPDIIDSLEFDLGLADKCVLSFIDKNGIEINLEVYLNGYVIYRSQEDYYFIIKIDEKLCNGIYDILHLED